MTMDFSNCTLVCRIDVHERLLILRKNSLLHVPILVGTFIVFKKKIPLHVYSILHIYWYWYVQNFTLLMIQNKVFQSIAKAIPKQSQSILKYSKVSQSIPKHPKVSQSSNGKKLPPQNSPLHSLILVCTFIDFEKKFPPAHLFHPARLLLLVCGYLGILWNTLEYFGIALGLL